MAVCASFGLNLGTAGAAPGLNAERPVAGGVVVRDDDGARVLLLYPLAVPSEIPFAVEPGPIAMMHTPAARV